MTDGIGLYAYCRRVCLSSTISLIVRCGANKAIYAKCVVTVVVNILNIVGNYSLIFGRFVFSQLSVK